MTGLFCVWCGGQRVRDLGEAGHQPTRILLCKTCGWKFELPLEWWHRRSMARARTHVRSSGQDSEHSW